MKRNYIMPTVLTCNVKNATILVGSPIHKGKNPINDDDEIDEEDEIASKFFGLEFGDDE